MKQLICETCGSTNLIKQDGVFACQSCGCKYSIEEAKRMMVEGVVNVSGSTVKVNDASKAENYLELATIAQRAGNPKEVELYCRKALEINPEDPEAWRKRGSAVLLQSRVSNSRIAEAITCFEKAIHLLEAKDYRTALNTFRLTSSNELYSASRALFKSALDLHGGKGTVVSAGACLRILKEIDGEVLPFLERYDPDGGHKILKGAILMTIPTIETLSKATTALLKEGIAWMDLTKKRIPPQSEKAIEYAERCMANLVFGNQVFETTKNLTDEDIRLISSGEITGEQYKEWQISLLETLIKTPRMIEHISPGFPNSEASVRLRAKWLHDLMEIDPSYAPKEPAPDSKPSSNNDQATMSKSDVRRGVLRLVIIILSPVIGSLIGLTLVTLAQRIPYW